jgi:hypothetical protein
MSEQDMQRLADAQGAGGGQPPIAVIIGAVLVLLLIYASLWKIFSKAGEPGWASIVPIYNIVVLVKISGKPVWWVVLYLIPCVSLIAAILVSIGLAERFGKGTGFGIGLAFLGPIFFPILAFGDAQYSPAPRT